MATGSILAITFGILLAFSLIASGYLFFSHRRGRLPKNTESATPFQNVKYDRLGQTKEGLLQPTPHVSIQSSNFGPQASEVIGMNVGHLLVSEMLQRSLTIPSFFPLICSPNLSPSPGMGNTDPT